MAREVPVTKRVNSSTRALLLEAAETLMREEGYAAVTSRRVGALAGVKAQLVHYYFSSMDELFITLYRQRAERYLQRVREAVHAEEPLRALWEQGYDPRDAALNLEFLALGNHRKLVRAEAVKYAQELREIRRQIIARFAEERGLKPILSPSALAFMMSGLGLLLVIDAESGMKLEHAEIMSFVEDRLQALSSIAKQG